jgi:PAS domain S-box-containing protein
MQKNNKNSESAKLRQKAEALQDTERSRSVPSTPLRDQSTQVWGHSEADYLRLIHEFEVHQIELELQNKELIAAKAKFQELAERYTELYDLAPTGYFTLSREGEILKLNLWGSQMLGKERSRLTGSRFDIAVSKETQPVFHHFLERVFTNIGKEICDVTLSTSENIPMHVRLTGIIAEDSGQCLITATDITEQKQAEEMLVKSEEYYRALFENNSTAIAIIEPDSTLSMVNEECCKMSGYTKEEIVGTSWTTLIPPGDLERLKEFNRRRMINPKDAPEKYEFTLYNKNGEIRSAVMSVTMMSNQNIKASLVDITNHKTMEESLQISEKRYKDLVENALVGIYATNLEGKFIFVNKAMSDILEFDSIEGLLQADVLSFYRNQHDREVFIELLKKSKQVFNYEVEIVTRKGKTMFLLVNAFIREEVITGMMMDISGRKQAENEIINLNAVLEQRIAERTKQLELKNKELAFHLMESEQFAYVSNHDLQEPLRNLIQFTQLLKENYGGKFDEYGNKYIDFIISSANRMKMLVTDLLVYSLLGKEREKTVVDCNRVVDAVLNDLGDSIKESSAKITVYELPTLNGFETELRLLFQNLISNAIKYQKKGNTPEINISAESNNDEWLFKISDNGIGIDAQYKDKIFVIFQRLHNRSEYEGTGIGLAHCKKIVEFHGGKIWMEPAPVPGSVFIFTMPKDDCI